ncbi:MAG TPA: hypothetical protein VMF64_14835 [Steroidobacteraceae bacterium]|nr:hypothetical protein [Steroidobacteraceae bacterium]
MKRTAAIWTAAWLLAGTAGAAMLPATALAQDWKQYSYPDAGFAIQFPEPPAVQHSTYQSPAGVALPMTRYVARQDGIVYTLDIVDFAGRHADGTTTIAEVEKSFAVSGKVTVAIDARVNREFGRELSVSGTDASRSAVALFFVDDHLFILQGRSLPPDAITRSGDAVRFEESLQFIGANRGFGGFRGFGEGGGFGRSGTFGRPTGGRFGAFNPAGVSACQGKSAGDSVQLQTPRGPVAATCTLVARPNEPPAGPPAPEPAQ